jgi:hypothetical protein
MPSPAEGDEVREKLRVGFVGREAFFEVLLAKIEKALEAFQQVLPVDVDFIRRHIFLRHKLHSTIADLKCPCSPLL